MMMPPSWAFPLLMPAVMIVLALLILVAVRASQLPPQPTRPRPGQRARKLDGGDNENALNLLRQRYVQGETDLDDFERRVEALVRRELPGRQRGRRAAGPGARVSE